MCRPEGSGNRSVAYSDGRMKAKDAAKCNFLILYFCLKFCCLVFTFYLFLSLHSDAALCNFHIALQDICWPTSLQRKRSMLVLSPCWHAGSGEQLQGKQISGLVLVGIFYPGVRILPGSLLTFPFMLCSSATILSQARCQI